MQRFGDVGTGRFRYEGSNELLLELSAGGFNQRCRQRFGKLDFCFAVRAGDGGFGHNTVHLADLIRSG